MTTLIKIYQRLKCFCLEQASQLLAYGFALTFGMFIIIQLFHIQADLQSNHRLLLANQSLASQQTLILKQLHRLETQFAVCESAVKTHPFLAEDIKACRAQLDTMKTDLHQLQIQTAPAALALFIQKETKRSLTSNPHQRKNSKQKQHVKTQHARDVRANTLPFHVCTIDLWNGEPMLMVNHENHTDLLSKHDTLAGWTVINIAFDSGKVLFKNRQGRLLKLTLP
jgi:hypothetical protein